ncbi:5'-methylthioadenosine/S-adenosylhomocysteine nucleosidase [Falsibacillus pallidus]|uniref:Adenosylhomocysteine nucleosidase n=1 Tax=Falsibacillus pallidus TaxID=493781 RepID=A0A370GCL4_9BACI|nr:5'-methylthioadenosine/S-adenosylhomocysteine nucleosidase [Falsibacillus pallidus]RDI40926.1 adenosylhomocysteine nucleosidase [Falsibacillus pallidus]
MKKIFFNKLGVITISAVLLLALGGWSANSASVAGTKKAKKPILIEGAMPIEVQNFAKKLQNVKEEKSGKFEFYKGTLDHYPVIVVKTGKGMENAAAATAVAIERYKPIAIINQGTAGGHDPKLHVADIVLGEKTVHLASFKTEIKGEGQGVDTTQWKPMDLMASEGSGSSSDAEKIRYYDADQDLLSAANAVKDQYTNGKVVEGTIGSADIWNNELDRIKYFHENFGTSAEEMEGFSEAQIANEYNIPFLDIRVLSNNKTNDGAYNPNTAGPCQDYVYNVVKKYISTKK